MKMGRDWSDAVISQRTLQIIGQDQNREEAGKDSPLEQWPPTFWHQRLVFWGFPGSSDDKESTCNARDTGLIPGSGRCPGKENGYPLQYSCLEKSMDRGAWQATVHGVTKSKTQLSNYRFFTTEPPGKPVTNERRG